MKGKERNRRVREGEVRTEAEVGVMERGHGPRSAGSFRKLAKAG